MSETIFKIFRDANGNTGAESRQAAAQIALRQSYGATAQPVIPTKEQITYEPQDILQFPGVRSRNHELVQLHASETSESASGTDVNDILNMSQHEALFGSPDPNNDSATRSKKL